MFKSALFVALSASIILLLSPQTGLLLQLKDLAKARLVSTDLSHETPSKDSTMSSVNQSVTRSVVKKVLSVEQSEVRLETYTSLTQAKVEPVLV